MNLRKFDASKNAKLGKFLGVEERKESVIEEAIENTQPVKDSDFLMPSSGTFFVPKSHDMIDEIRGLSDELSGDKILVCPKCKRNVEPDFPLYRKPVHEVIYEPDKNFRKRPVFCTCSACQLSFFIAELVIQKSWRKKFRNESGRFFEMNF